ncbi:hypothetical protein [Streptomyces incanus]|uniref:Uncharacterized protein n=1 Tax=Streptomyces incanus TaxID=887453 RepID=A0ABW0XK60_9ACTN
MAEDSSSRADIDTTEEGGGGGGDSSSEDKDQNRTRAEAFVSRLDSRGKVLDKRQQQQLCALVAAAFTAGWSERGLRRYLDISDDPNVRSAAALYLHRLNPDRLPDSGQAEAVAAGLPPIGPDCFHDPRAVADVSLRTAPLGGPCPDCHPDAVQQSGKPGLPPVCDTCVRANPAAQYNVRFRTDPMSFTKEPCPRCHPDKVGEDVLPGDRRVKGWMDLARQLAAEEAVTTASPPMVARNGHRNYELPQDRSVYQNGFGGGYQPYRDPTDESVYDKDL